MTATTSTSTALNAIISKVAPVVSGGVSINITEAIQDLSADAVNLAGQEAEDFGNLIDNMAQDVETGMTWASAWEKNSAAFVSSEKSQLYQDAMTVLKQAATIFDEWINAVKATIAAVAAAV